ncbi:MAG: TonB-dependent receptor [Proteobacteria bacterium]|nr:TonB-dependent receptor [Pseudomonadota bacterium]
MRFDPLTELQSRGMAEGQSDVTVRGSVFENTGFKLGAVSVMDPQTGHYVAELPVDPALMSTPAILKGIDGAVEGFNSAVATVSYGIARVTDGGNVSLGFGGDSLEYQALRFGEVSDDGFGIAFSAARSEGDGTVPSGDHEFARYNLQLQFDRGDVRTDMIVGYQDKFYGWPGAYTGFAFLPETDDTQTTFVLLNRRRESASGWFEYGGFYRRLEDDYDFNRADFETGVPGSFEHETEVMAIGFQGLQRRGRVDWRYGGQVTRDELVRSTDLTSGTFNDRTYATLSVVPSLDTELADGKVLTWRAGLTVDYSNRDSNRLSPLLGVSLDRPGAGGTTVWSLEYAATSQLPGYTALNSRPSGLFGGNPSLGREVAKQLAASVVRDTGSWQARATLFTRRDEDLVDWTYATGAPFARQANPVDIDVVGFEAFFAKSWDTVDVAAGYTALDKDADYGGTQVDASFYALNFAKHRATLALRYRFADRFELRLDNEYREQEDNPLRVGDGSTYLVSAAVEWQPGGENGFSVSLLADNLTDSEFQPFPGTPAAGRQYSVSASYLW